jgi:hypothetical protein
MQEMPGQFRRAIQRYAEPAGTDVVRHDTFLQIRHYVPLRCPRLRFSGA